MRREGHVARMERIDSYTGFNRETWGKETTWETHS